MERVYHYTSMDVLLKLIQSVKVINEEECFVFQATNIFFMNDPKEFIFGQEMLMDVLRDIEYDKDVDYNLRLSSTFSKKEEKSEEVWLKELLDEIQKQNGSPYVISFSRNEDSLPMWLNYGDGGKGVCLAFAEYRSKVLTKKIDSKSIAKAQVEIFDKLGTQDIYYEGNSLNGKGNDLRQLLDSLYDYYLKSINSISSNQLFEYKKEALRAFMQVTAPYIKTIDYKGEREVRLAKSIDSDKDNVINEVEFRCNAKGHLIPYINVKIPTKQLDYVRIGPLADKELSIKVIEMIKKKYGLQFGVRESEIKYRDY